MHWIEQVTGWNPDGGNGSLESALTVALVGFLLMLGCLLVIERNARKLGRAGIENLTSTLRGGSVGGFFDSASRQWRDRGQDSDSA